MNVSEHLKPDEDYYLNEQGLLVFTAKFHLKRGYCCQNGCRHCPYGFSKNEGRDIAEKDGQEEESPDEISRD